MTFFKLFPLFPLAASTSAREVDQVFLSILALCVLVCAGIFTTLLIFCVRYRKGSPAKRPPLRVSSTPIEIFWTAVPAVIMLVFFIWSARVFMELYSPPADATEIYVVGKQWMWKFQHSDGQREINELHVPIGQAVKLTMTSEDVIHSLFVPAFRIKQDLVPGRYTTVWFKANRIGEYHLFCAQYCGLDHAGMGRARVIVQSPAEYAKWAGREPGGGIRQVSEGTMASRGRSLFRKLGCTACHGREGNGATIRGPTLEGVYGSRVPIEGGTTVLADEDYLRESILQPKAKIVQGFEPIMPSFAGQVSEDELLQLIAYLKALKFGASAFDSNPGEENNGS